MQLSVLETPCLILDKAKLECNIARMREQTRRLGVQLRPHGKTAKNIEVARMALAGQFGGIAVSTVKEAEYYFEHGIKDIIYAVGIAPIKLDRVAQLAKRGAAIAVILDSIEQAQAATRIAQAHGVTLPALIEIDSDGHRSGVRPDDPLLVEIGSALNRAKGVQLKGVLTHAGDSYACKTLDEIRKVSLLERDAAVRCAETLRKAGLPCPAVSIGSTPTAAFARDDTGITEVRAGVYMFGDLTMAGLGVCAMEDIAVSVLASVIGHQRQKGWVITDSGWMSLSHDRRTARQKVDQGFGVVCDIEGRPYPDLILVDAYQEHGVIGKRKGMEGKPDFDRFPIGSMVRILPNHACAAAAQHDRYHVVCGDTEVADVWERFAGW